MAGAGASEKSSSAKQSSSAKYQKAIGPSQPKTSFKDFIGAESFDYGKALGSDKSFVLTSGYVPGKSSTFGHAEDSKPTPVKMGDPSTMTKAQAQAELKKMNQYIAGSGGDYSNLSSFDQYNFSSAPFSLEEWKKLAKAAGGGSQTKSASNLNIIHGGGANAYFQTGADPVTANTTNSQTTTGNTTSYGQSSSANTLQSSKQGVTISDEAKAKAQELNLELVNTDAIQGTSEADTLQKKQAALLEAQRRQSIRRLIARNRRSRFGGSRMLMSQARANPGLGVTPVATNTLSPRFNPRDANA
jgi:hypothetical protein